MYYRRNSIEFHHYPYLLVADRQLFDFYIQIEKSEYDTRKRMVDLLALIKEDKQKLADEDYKTIKYIQGKITDAEFAEVKTYCEGLRTEINASETEYAELLEAHPTWTEDYYEA